MEPEQFKNYDRKGYMAELDLGKFSPMEAERKKVIEDAKARGENPDKALLKLEEKFKRATNKLRADQADKKQKEKDAEQTVAELQRYMNSRSSREKE